MKTRKVDSCGYVPARQKTKPLPKAKAPAPGTQLAASMLALFRGGASVYDLAADYSMRADLVEEVLRGGLRPRPRKGKR